MAPAFEPRTVEAYAPLMVSEADRLRLNHPSAIWRAWKCERRGQRWRAEGADDGLTYDSADATTVGVARATNAY